MPDTTVEPVPAVPRELPDGFPCAAELTTHRALLAVIVDGTAVAPPCVERLALPKPTAWKPGWIESEATVSDDLSWAVGVIMGGYLTCVADFFAGLAMLTMLPSDAHFLTAAVSSMFHRPALPGQMRVEATIAELSGRKALVEVLIFQNGQVIVTTRATQIILRGAAAPTPKY
jgi:acyl-CoA thioesterase